MVKDRLNELKQFKDKNEKNKNATVEIEINNAQDGTENANKKLRETFERTDIIGQWIGKLEHNNQDIRLYLRRIDDIKNQKDVEEKLKDCFQNNTNLAHQISTKLKEVENEVKQIQEDSAEKRIKTIQYTSLKKRFENAFIEDNHLLENYKSVQKQVIKSQLMAKGYFQVTDEEVTSLLEEGTDIQLFTENILAETAEAKRVLADVEERHQKLLQIERMLSEVRDMFVQMAILVDSQQELVDRIEYQAQAATEYVGAGTGDLEKAKTKKKKTLKTKIYILIAVTILIVVLLVVLLR